LSPDRFVHERDLRDRGVAPVAGIDEAGRGPLAGPVVAAAVVLPVAWVGEGLPASLEGLNDSKQLTEKKRESLFSAIRECNEIDFAVAVVEAEEIDRTNILQATHAAMNRALAALRRPPPHALVDGNPVKTLTVPQTAIVRGDSLSFSIAAASVLAKVTRDRLMIGHDRSYPAYGFAKHKGYGTREHLAAIERHGPCPIHRMSFAPLKPPAQRDLFQDSGWSR
jgi:ribonuclease HII